MPVPLPLSVKVAPDGTVSALNAGVVPSTSLAETLKLSYTINLSIKLAEDGTPKVTEMNPRLGAGMFLPISGGVNFPLLSVHMARRMEIDVPKFNYGLSMYIYRGYLVMDKDGNMVAQTKCEVVKND